jgi:hypothetical protein
MSETNDMARRDELLSSLHGSLECSIGNSDAPTLLLSPVYAHNIFVERASQSICAPRTSTNYPSPYQKLPDAVESLDRSRPSRVYAYQSYRKLQIGVQARVSVSTGRSTRIQSEIAESQTH